jgi:hypothetical protein
MRPIRERDNASNLQRCPRSQKAVQKAGRKAPLIASIVSSGSYFIAASYISATWSQSTK